MDQTALQELVKQCSFPEIFTDKLVRIGIATVAAFIAYLIFSRISNYWLNNVLGKVVDRGNFRKSREKQIKSWSLFVDRTGGILILFILFLTVLSDLNYNITPLLTGAGIVGLAVGLGSQNFMKDVVGGIFIFLEGNYSEGDRVKMAGVSGKVKKISLRKTFLYSEEENTTHVIPHSEVKTVSILLREPFPKSSKLAKDGAKGLPKKKSVVKK